MSADKERPTFIARNSLYEDLEERSEARPRFLRRNLRRILDQHQSQILRERRQGGDAQLVQHFVDKEREVAEWVVPDPATIARMMKEKPYFRIDYLNLRHLKYSNKVGDRQNASRQHEASEFAGEGPNWLPSCEKWKLCCQVFVRIAHQSSPEIVTFHEVRDAQIVRHESHKGPPEFELVLERPFEIKIEQLHTQIAFEDDDGIARWTRKADIEDYVMNIGITCKSSDDTAELLSQLESRSASTYKFASGEDAALTCSWNELPNLPSSRHVMLLKRTHEGRRKALLYGIEASTWHGHNSPLVRYNRARQLRTEARQLPTPSVSDDLEHARTRWRVHYLMRTNFVTRGAIVDGLTCVLCRRDIEHSSPERLMLHYLTVHDHMDWTIDDEYTTDSLLVVRVKLDESSHDRNDVEETHQNGMNWQAPESAFDIEAHLYGEREWALPSQRGVRSAHNTPRRPKSTKVCGRRDNPLAQPQLQPLAIANRKRAVTAPEDVVDLPPLRGKIHPVPEVEGISFYRTISKQRVAPGTEISDSEDEADTSWVLQSQRRDQTELGVSQVAQDFNELLNRHLDEETPLSDSFTRDAVVRFARKFKSQLSVKGWREEFESKLRQLESKRVVNKDTVRYCVDVIQSEDQDTAGKPNSKAKDERTAQEGDNTAQRTINGQLGVDSPDLSPRPTKPLGHRDILCNRTGTAKSSGLIPIQNLIFDNEGRKARGKLSVDAIRPTDVDYEKLVQILDHHLRLRRDIDHIVCIGVNGGTFCPIVDQRDLSLALAEHVSSTTDDEGPIVFELHDQTSFERGLEQSLRRVPEGKRDALASARQAALTINKGKSTKKKECICGVEIQGMRGAFSCGNPLCLRNFHLSCLKMDRRPQGTWLCEDCSE